jgi:hypothetical protein
MSPPMPIVAVTVERGRVQRCRIAAASVPVPRFVHRAMLSPRAQDVSRTPPFGGFI